MRRAQASWGNKNQVENFEIIFLDITPDLGWHRPRRTGADMCKTGAGAGSSAEADTLTDCRLSNHGRTDYQTGRLASADADVDGGWRVHAADDVPSRHSAAKADAAPSCAKGGGTPPGRSSVDVGEARDMTSRGIHNGDAVTRECREQHRLGVMDPEHARKRSCRRRVIAVELPTPDTPGHSNRNYCAPMIPEQMRRPQRHNWLHNRWIRICIHRRECSVPEVFPR